MSSSDVDVGLSGFGALLSFRAGASSFLALASLRSCRLLPLQIPRSVVWGLVEQCPER